MDLNTQWFVFTPNPVNAEMKTATYCIDYMNNGGRWTAKFKDGKFYHYNNGNPKDCHTDDHLDYDGEDGKLHRMEIKDGKILIGPFGGPVAEGQMKYKGWDGKLWNVDLVRLIDLHQNLN